MPMKPVSWPEKAAKSTSLSGEMAAIARTVSSQHAMPPPRSPAHCHHPLRGVETTNGGCDASLPPERPTPFEALHAVRDAPPGRGISPRLAACLFNHD